MREWALAILMASSLAFGADRRIKFYRNPMNPSITSKVPMKDNMGMDYIPVYEDTDVKSQALVPGRGPVRLGEGQLALAGATLVQASRGPLEVDLPVGGRALSSSRVSLQIPEHDLPRVKPGLEVRLESPSSGGATLTGKVVSLDSILDPMTRSLRADVQLQKPVSGLRPESSVTGSVLMRKLDALLVPDPAVMYLDGKAYVYVADREKGIFSPKIVKLGLRNSSQIEVIDGLAEGDWISSGPNFLIDSESRIQAPR